MNRTAQVDIGGRTITVSPLNLGGYKRQKNAMAVLNQMFREGQQATADGDRLAKPEEVEAMASIVADAAGYFTPDQPAADVARAEFFRHVDGLDFLDGIRDLSRAVRITLGLSGEAKAPTTGEGKQPGEVASP